MDNQRATLKKHCFVWTLLMVVVIHFGSCAPRKCLHDMTYFDKHTNRRECCADICQYAQLTNSEDDCKSKCPKYNAPQAAPIRDSKPEEEQAKPQAKEFSSQASSNDFIPAVLVTIAVLAVCAMAVVALVALNRKLCARTRPPHDTNQRQQAGRDTIEMAGQQNQGNDEASTALLTLGSSRNLSRPGPAEGDFQGRHFDQLENHGQPGNGFADNHLAANTVNNQLDAPVRRGVGVYAQLQQQANDVDAERNQSIGAAREAQPLPRPIDETGEADGVNISLQAVGN